MKLQNKAVIENILYSPLGGKDLSPEFLINAEDTQTGLLEYYRYAAKHITRNYMITSGAREIVIPFISLFPGYNLYDYFNYYPQLTNQYYPVPNGEILSKTKSSTAAIYNDKWFYIGVFSANVRNQLGQTRFDEYLLGMQYSTPIYDPLQRELSNSIIDMNMGDVYYEENGDVETVNFVVGGSCWLSVNFGIGSTDVNDVMPRHIKTVAKCIAIPYYQRVLALRNTVVWDSADFKMNVELVQERLQKWEEEVQTELSALSQIPLFFS